MTDGFLLFDTVAEGVMINADVAIGGGFIYVVWEDQITREVMFRRGVYYKKTVAVENTSVLINQPEKGQKYFTVNMPGILTCTLVDSEGHDYEEDVSYPISPKLCRVSIEDLDQGRYTVKIFDEQGKTFTAVVEVK